MTTKEAILEIERFIEVMQNDLRYYEPVGEALKMAMDALEEKNRQEINDFNMSLLYTETPEERELKRKLGMEEHEQVEKLCFKVWLSGHRHGVGGFIVMQDLAAIKQNKEWLANAVADGARDITLQEIEDVTTDIDKGSEENA